MVEDFKYDVTATYLRDPAKIEMDKWSAAFVPGQKITEVKFYDPVVHWKLHGHWFSGAVPIQIYKHEENGLFIQRTSWHEDIQATEIRLEVMITESRKLRNPRTCPECNGKGYHVLPPPSIEDFEGGEHTIDMNDVRCYTCNCTGVIDAQYQSETIS